MLGLVLLATAPEPGNVAIAGASAYRYYNCSLLPGLLDLINRTLVLNADRSLDKRHIHLWNVPDIGEGQAVDKISIFVKNGEQSFGVVCQGHKTACTSTHVHMANCNLLCHRLFLLFSNFRLFFYLSFRRRRFLRRHLADTLLSEDS